MWVLAADENNPVWNLDNTNLRLVAVVLTLWLLLILGSGWLVLHASKAPPPLALVLTLSIVTLVCIAAFVVTRDQVVLQLASVGLGAIAAAVATTWGITHRRENDELQDKYDQLKADVKEQEQEREREEREKREREEREEGD